MNRTMPTATVIPVLAYEDVVGAVDWLCRVFGFTERWRAGTHRAQLAYGNGAVVVADRQAGAFGATDSVLIRVDDVDAHIARARRLGATIVQPPTDHPYGERQYTATDLEGRAWTFSQSIADVAPEEWGGTSATL